MNPELGRIFKNVQSDLPELTAGAAPLGSGCFGIAIAHNDNSVRKIIFAPSDNDHRQRAIDSLANEINALRLLAGSALVPALLEAPSPIHRDGYLASYRMTHIDGKSLELFPNTPGKPEKERLRIVGRLLAQFHQKASSLPFSRLRGDVNFTYCEDIPCIPNFPDRINLALERANTYFHAHKKPAVVHGDFHGGNIIWDGENTISGLVDFASTGWCSNHLSDLTVFPDYALDDVIKGYEEQSGEKIDPMMVIASRLSFWAQVIYKIYDQPAPAKYTSTLEKVYTHLNNMIPVTEIKP